MSTLNCLEVQIAVALMFTHGRIPCIGKRTAVSRAQSGQVILIAAEGLHCGPTFTKQAGELSKTRLLCFERTVTIVDDLPDHIILNHFFN